MSGSLTRFIQSVAQTGLMSADEVWGFIQSLDSDEPRDEAALAAALEQHGRLTAFQAEILRRGELHRLIFGDYLLLDQIGTGGMGQVFKALHRRMKRIVALKALPPTATASESSVKRFYKEVEAAARLTHPNIVTAYDAGESGGVHYLVMEYVDGQDVSALVHHKGTLPVEMAVEIAVQAAHGLDYAHKRGVYHRDIKLANLLLDREGTVKVLDMGLARLTDPSDSQSGEGQTDGITHTNQMMGTADYIAPEQARNSKLADHRADIYSLGCCLYRMIAGKPPYDADSVFMKVLAHVNDPIPQLNEINDAVSEPLQAVFAKMLAKKPDDRYQSMADVVAALKECVEIELKMTESSRLTGLVPEHVEHCVDRNSDQPTLPTSADDLGTSAPALSPLAPPDRPAARVAESESEEQGAAIALDAASEVAPPAAEHPHDADTPRSAETVPAPSQPAEEPAAAAAPPTAAPQEKSGPAEAPAADWKQQAADFGVAAASKTRQAAARTKQWVTSPENRQRAAAVRGKAVAAGRAMAEWYRARRRQCVRRFPKLRETHVDWIAASAAGLLVIVSVITLSSLASTDPSYVPRPDAIVLHGPPRPEPGPSDTDETVLAARLADPPSVKADRPPLQTPVAPGKEAGTIDSESGDRTEVKPTVPEVKLGGRKTLDTPKIIRDPLDDSRDLISMIRRGYIDVGSYRLDKGHLLIAPDVNSLKAANKPATARVPYLPPEEYDLEIVGIRSSGSGGLLISLPQEVRVGDPNLPPEFQQRQKLPTLVIGPLVSRPRGRLLPRVVQGEQPAQRSPIVVRSAQPTSVLIKVRKASISVKVNDKPVDFTQIFDPYLDAQFRRADDKTFRIGVYTSSWRVTRFAVTEITGEGKPLE